ncbi:MAG: hypothetical protein ACYSX0_11770 [Planctomycetota bacterium]|jgi:predicted  nucleic acid-binding Zn-ribbon protein
MRCEAIRDWLRRDLDGVADPSAEAAAHLQACDACLAEAGRLKAVAETARAALPAAEVPSDFTDRVLAQVEAPAGDAALADAVRPRWGQRAAFVALLVSIPVLFFVLFRPKSVELRGDLYVERDGQWIAQAGPGSESRFGLEPLGTARLEECELVAMQPTILRAARRLHLEAGSAIVEAQGATTIETPLAEVRLRPQSTCLVRIQCEESVEEEMSLSTLKRMTPVLLAVTVLAGGVTVANGQGEEEANKNETIEVKPGHPPAIDREAVLRELERMRVAVERLKEHVERAGKVRDYAQAARDRVRDALARVEGEASDLRAGMLRLESFLEECDERLSEQRKRGDAPFVKGAEPKLREDLDTYRVSLKEYMELLERHPERAEEIAKRLEETRRSAYTFGRAHGLVEPREEQFKRLRDHIHAMQMERAELARKRAHDLDAVRIENAELRKRVNRLEAELARRARDPELPFEEMRFTRDDLHRIHVRLDELLAQLAQAKKEGEVEKEKRLERERKRLDTAAALMTEIRKKQSRLEDLRAKGEREEAAELATIIEKEEEHLRKLLTK